MSRVEIHRNTGSSHRHVTLRSLSRGANTRTDFPSPPGEGSMLPLVPVPGAAIVLALRLRTALCTHMYIKIANVFQQ